MDILIEMDISYLFHNYKKRAEIAIISSDRGFDNYIKNFNILTGDNLILRRINRTSNIYEKLEENAEDCINTEKSAELTIERLKGNMPNLPKDLKSLKNIIANVAYAEKKKIDAEKVTATIEKINEALKGQEIDKQVKQKLNYAKKHWPAALRNEARQAGAQPRARGGYGHAQGQINGA
jgi:hypothetical protein